MRYLFITVAPQFSTDLTLVLEKFNYRGQDALFDKIFILLGNEKPGVHGNEKKLAFPKIYTLLLDVMDDKEEEKSALMKKFLDSWYKNMRPVAWQ